MFSLRKVLFVTSLLGMTSLAFGVVSGISTSSNGSQESTVDSAPAVANFSVSPAIAATGQFIQFDWATNQASSFQVSPGLFGEEEEQLPLPLSATGYVQVAPVSSTTYRATAVGSGGGKSPITTASVTIVPVTIAPSRKTILAGESLTLTYSGPDNGSSYSLITLPANVSIALHPESCSGAVCKGTFPVDRLGRNTTYQVSATGPNQGQAYSQQVSIMVVGGSTLALTTTPLNSSGDATLAWQSSNVVALTIDQGIGPVAATRGSYVVHPSRTTTYTATGTDRFGNQVTMPATVNVSTGDVSSLNHIVYMLQENRAFDNYFGNLAYYRVYIDHIQGAQMSDVNDLHNLPPGYTIQNPQGQSFAPFHQRTECTEGLNPSWNESHTDMDLVGGNWLDLTNNSLYLMDKFLFTTAASQYDPTETRGLGYYDWTDLPFYYELATQFDTSDTWYSALPASTVNNRMYLFAATSYGNIFTPPSNDLEWHRPTIFRVLTNAGINWRYYYQDNSVFLAQWADWNNPQIQANVRNIQEWYNILGSPQADQQLPQVVFIERASATAHDEHPGNNIQLGAATVQQILSALLTSNAWPDSAFILSYDEGGGTFDHVGPILVTQPDDWPPKGLENQFYIHGLFNVTGFRVPVITVSPYSKPHFVSHLATDFTSILKLIETRYNLPPMTQRDRTTGDLTDPTNGPFDFSSPQMLVVPPLPTQPTNGTCNYQLESYPQ
jgi:phospholipase C